MVGEVTGLHAGRETAGTVNNEETGIARIAVLLG
jgi:hypothetical protein